MGRAGQFFAGDHWSPLIHTVASGSFFQREYKLSCMTSLKDVTSHGGVPGEILIGVVDDDDEDDERDGDGDRKRVRVRVDVDDVNRLRRP